jgi:uncharacterized membrane protein
MGTSLKLMAAAQLTTDDLTQQAWFFIPYTFCYDFVYWRKRVLHRGARRDQVETNY